MILVTGGTGLVGAHLLHYLCKNEHDLAIVAIYRNIEKLAITKEVFELYEASELFDKITWKQADINDIPSLEIVFKNITKVYHCAAMVSFNIADKNLLRKTNIEGTANIVNFCTQYKIEKLCYVSSIATLDKTPGKLVIDETCEWNPEDHHSDYNISKYGAEMEVWRAGQEGLPVVMVNPGLIFGFGNWHMGTGKMLQRAQQGMPFYTDGSTGVVDVIDVVIAMVKLMNSSIENKRFILVAENKTYKDLLTLIAEKLHKKAPRFSLPKMLSEITWRVSFVLSLISFQKIKGLHKYTAKSAFNKSSYDGTPIIDAIDFKYTNFENTIENVIDKL